MKKLLLALFLLVLLIGISYVKKLRQDDKVSEAHQSARQELSRELSEKEGQIDSLAYLAGQQQVQWADSLTKKHADHWRQVDSLENVIEKKSDSVGSLETQLQELRGAEENSSKGNISSAATSKNRHERILALYKKKHKALPTDLSEYERRVSLAEIREETARKFSISLAELDRIRAEYKLKY